MKIQDLILTSPIVALLFVAGCDSSHDHAEHADHDADVHLHEEAVTAGPNGGHLVRSEALELALEVVVDAERKARITLLDAQDKAMDSGEMLITGIAGERSQPVALTFTKGEGGVLISDKELPEGAHVPMILVIKASPDAKPVTERFEVHIH